MRTLWNAALTAATIIMLSAPLRADVKSVGIGINGAT